MAVFLLTSLAAFLGAFIGTSIGVLGGVHAVRRRVAVLEDDAALLDQRVTRLNGSRAGIASVAQRKANMDEAALVAAATAFKHPEPQRLPGRLARG